MTKQAISLGRVFNIPIGLDYSWFLIFVLLTWTLAVSYFPRELTSQPVALYWFLGAVTTILLFVSVLLHELGHSLIALRYNIRVARITLFIFGGIAQIAGEPPNAMAEFWIAAAGPLVSLALAGIFTGIHWLIAASTPLLALLQYLAYINLSLAFFNLIPGFPLDGGRVFRAIVWGLTHNFRRATLAAANLGRVVAFLFILVGVWQVLAGNFGGGLWIIFIGWFLDSAASSQVQQQLVQALLAGHTVSQVMSRSFTTVPADITLQDLVSDCIVDGGRRYFMVEQGQKIVGLLTLHQIKTVPRQEWSTTRAGEVLIPLNQMKVVGPDAELWDTLGQMDQDGVNQLPVMQEAQVVGMLTRENILGFLRTLRELGV